MAGAIHRFRAGMGLDDFSAADLNEIVRVVEAVRGMTVEGPYTVDWGSGNLTLRNTERGRAGLVQPITVVVSRPPVTGDRSVGVRQVRFRHLPPMASPANCDDADPEDKCTYDWAGDVFEAYPDFGARPEDFGQYHWTGEGPPQLETPFMRARFEGVWVVELPTAAAGMRWVVIREIPNVDANFVKVQDVSPERNEEGWTGKWKAVGDPVEDLWSAAVHPYQLAGDFEGFVEPVPAEPAEVLPEAACILTAFQIGGLWWVDQYIRFEIPLLAADTVYNDCRPLITD